MSQVRALVVALGMAMDYLSPYLPQDAALYSVFVLGILVIFSVICWAVAKRFISMASSNRFIDSTSTQLDNFLITEEVLGSLSYCVPAFIFYNFASEISQFTVIIERGSIGVIALSVVLLVQGVFNGIEEFYKTTEYSKSFQIKSYIQVAKLIVWICGIVVIVSVLMGRSPTILISGIGAMTAVILLVFRDTILSFVASVQINSNNLFRVGDWIEVPQFGADGEVVDIALQGVRIENWDKTITVIPTHRLIDSTFKNWKNMEESGGRRIKRSIFIDMNSISLCDEETIGEFKKIELIADYIKNKQDEIEEYNRIHGIDTSEGINGRNITNIGTYRAYIESYLKNNVNIHKEMTLMVRQMEPSEKGLPIQIYAFTNSTDWIDYEIIQADIFDHVIAVIPEFGLKIFQRSTDIGR
jgi:miniconductance mechanosensitive channel